jgi:hypothetical protein
MTKCGDVFFLSLCPSVRPQLPLSHTRSRRIPSTYWGDAEYIFIDLLDVGKSIVFVVIFGEQSLVVLSCPIHHVVGPNAANIGQRRRVISSSLSSPILNVVRSLETRNKQDT